LKRKNLIKIEFWTRNSLSFREHYFQRFVVKDLKFSTCLSIYDFEFAFSELNVKDSTTNRKSCKTYLNSIFFCDDLFFFIRRLQIISSSFLDVQRNSFSLLTSCRYHCFNAFFISEELDLERKFAHETKIFIKCKTHC
jgi:hypothetical protein